MKRAKHRLILLGIVSLLSAIAVCSGRSEPVLGADNDTSSTILNWLRESNAHLGSESQFLAAAQTQLSDAMSRQQSLLNHVASARRQLDVDRQNVIPILRFQYEHGPSSGLWIAMLLSSRDWESMQSNLANVLEILRQRDLTLHQYVQHLQDEVRLESAAESLVEDLQIVRDNLVAEQTFYAQSVQIAGGQSSNLTSGSMTGVTNLLQDTWNTSIAPAVGQLLQQLDSAVAGLPDALPQDDVTVSVTHAEATIPQAVLNQVIHQTPSMKNVQFLFRTHHVFLSATANGQRVLVMGHLVVQNDGKRADFDIDDVAVDGILVNPNLASQWLSQYAFFIDVSRLSSHLRIQSVSVEDQTLHLNLRPVF